MHMQFVLMTKMTYPSACYIFIYLPPISGILAAMWPCGIITHVSELYTAESKSQVYGQLHDLLQTESAMATNLSAFIHVHE